MERRDSWWPNEPGRKPLLLAIDPGGTTGLFECSGTVPVEAHQFKPADAADYIYEYVRQTGVFVVCESFVPRPGRRTWQPDALYLIGFTMHVCRQEEVDFRLQTPAQAKSFATDAKLKKLGWYWPGHGHANDAARHALVASVAIGTITGEDLLDV
jgi:hypothetical protein